MNKINPLFILLFSIVIFLVSLTTLNESKNTLKVLKDEKKEYLKIAINYSMLQKAWGDTSLAQKNIEFMLKAANIQNAKINTHQKELIIDIKNASIKSIDKFLNKVLNDKIIIKDLTLTTNSLFMKVEL